MDNLEESSNPPAAEEIQDDVAPNVEGAADVAPNVEGTDCVDSNVGASTSGQNQIPGCVMETNGSVGSDIDSMPSTVYTTTDSDTENSMEPNENGKANGNSTKNINDGRPTLLNKLKEASFASPGASQNVTGASLPEWKKSGKDWRLKALLAGAQLHEVGMDEKGRPLAEIPLSVPLDKSDAPVAETPSSVPLDKSDATLAETPSSEPLDKSDATLAETPSSEPLDKSDATLAETPSSEPLDKSDATLVETPSSEPLDKSDATLAETPSSEPLDKSDETLAETPSSEPLDKSDASLAETPSSEPLDKSDATLAETPSSVPLDATAMHLGETGQIPPLEETESKSEISSSEFHTEDCSDITSKERMSIEQDKRDASTEECHEQQKNKNLVAESKNISKTEHDTDFSQTDENIATDAESKCFATVGSSENPDDPLNVTRRSAKRSLTKDAADTTESDAKRKKSD